MPFSFLIQFILTNKLYNMTILLYQKGHLTQYTVHQTNE